MRQIGYGLVVAGGVCLIIWASGYITSRSGRLFSEPVQWLTLTPALRDQERQKAVATLRSWWPSFRRTGVIGIALIAVGVTLALIG